MTDELEDLLIKKWVPKEIKKIKEGKMKGCVKADDFLNGIID